MEAATTSLPTTTIMHNQYVRRIANPAHGCRYISAYSPNDPAAGCAAAISASAHIIVSAMHAPPTKLRITAGPASFTEMALPRNKPVPIVLPMPIMASWAGVRLRWRPPSCSTIFVDEGLLLGEGCPMGGSIIARNANRKSPRQVDLNERTVNDAARLSSGGLAPLCRVSYNLRRGSDNNGRGHGGNYESGPGARHHLCRHIFPRDSGSIAELRAGIAAERGCAGEFLGSASKTH